MRKKRLLLMGKIMNRGGSLKNEVISMTPDPITLLENIQKPQVLLTLYIRAHMVHEASEVFQTICIYGLKNFGVSSDHLEL